MKYIKVKIKRGNAKKGEHQMVYPDCYDATEVQQVLVGGILYPNEIGRGASEEDCVMCLSSDELANEYIAESSGDIIELTEIEVDTYMSTRWEMRNESEEKVSDPNRLMAIQLKHQLGKPLTIEDEDALNPDKRTPGINRVNRDHNIFFHRFKVDNEK